MSDLSTRILTALTVDPAPYEDMHGHTAWAVTNVMSELQPSDLNAVEILAVAIILAQAHARKLAGRTPPIGTITPLRENIAG